ncbi:hypothetical protein OPIT5_25280 [Opitutaceae bacterium TAV5]|nr:hypothetical protein OPIT5_25280 [Opitutaceae bacterium TAV5]
MVVARNEKTSLLPRRLRAICFSAVRFAACLLAGGLLTKGMFAASEEWGKDRPRPAGGNWRFSCRLENVGADDAAWVELRDATGGRLYRAGVAGGRSRLEQWQAGAWKRLWTGEPPADEAITGSGLDAARRTEGVGVFCFNGYLFIEVGEPGDVRHVVPPPDVAVQGDIDPSTGKVFEAGTPAGTPAPGEIDWTVRAGTSAAGVKPRIVDIAFAKGSRPQVKRAPDAPPLQREAIACYIPWFPADFTALGYQRQNDFPVVPLRAEAGYDVLAEEFRLMAAGGVTAVSADIVFFTPDRVRAGIVTFKRFLKTARSAGLGEFRVAPFVELKNIPMAVAAALYMMERMGDDPAWLRTGRRGETGGLPVFLTYHHPVHLKMTPELWKSLLEGVREGGRDAYWVYNFDGLTPALTGRVDRSEADKIMPVSDAVFHFGGASLRDSAGFTKFIREQFSQKYPKVAVGASVHVGYYAARTYSRNLISPRHTEELREMWALAEEGRPDFIHLTTWNDWNEATTFCPSFGDAGSRLEIMGRLLAGFLGKPLPEGKPGVPELVLSYRKSVYPGEPLRLEVLPLPTQNSERLREVRCEVMVTEAASGRVVLRATSPALVMDASAARGAMRPWYAGIEDEKSENALQAPGVLRVAARAWVDGREIRYHHLPDVVVSEPEGSNDQLFYSVPLHRLAGPERRVRLEINGRDGRGDANGDVTTSTVTGSGLYGVRYEVSGPGAADTLVAGMKRGHLMRFLAPLSCDGAEVVELDQPVRLAIRRPQATTARANGRGSRLVAESSGRWTLSERGADYFSALARFEDGSWAWSPTVLAAPPVPATAVLADWVFSGPKPALMGNVAGLNKPRNIIEDRSIYRQDLTLPEKNGLRFVTLSGSGRACQFDGNTVLRAEPDTAGNGPVAIEVLFSPGQAGRHETVCWQRGAQAGLVVDAAGHLVASRLPELRKHPRPFVEVRSRRPLETGRFCHAVAQFTGSALELWIDGELQERQPCVGTRSTEGFSIGGNSGGRTAATAVDEMPSEGFFTGRLARLTIYGRSLPESVVKDLHRVARQLPFFETNPQ